MDQIKNFSKQFDQFAITKFKDLCQSVNEDLIWIRDYVTVIEGDDNDEFENENTSENVNFNFLYLNGYFLCDIHHASVILLTFTAD